MNVQGGSHDHDQTKLPIAIFRRKSGCTIYSINNVFAQYTISTDPHINLMNEIICVKNLCEYSIYVTSHLSFYNNKVLISVRSVETHQVIAKMHFPGPVDLGFYGLDKL